MRVAPGITKYVGTTGTSYFVRIRMKGTTATATFARLTDAKKWRDVTRAEIIAGKFRDKPKSTTTVGSMIDQYLRDAHVGDEPIRILGIWKDLIGDRDIESITPAEIRSIRNELRDTPKANGEPRSNSTCNRHTAYLSSCWSWACGEEVGIASENPVKAVKKLTEPRGRVRYLTDDERDALLEACQASPEPHLYEFVVAALSTGARAGELQRLDWADIDFVRGFAVLRQTKNGTQRSVPIRGHLLELLKARRGIGAVFHHADGRAPFDYDKSWRPAVKASGVPDFRFHDLRHTAASYLAQDGATLLQIAELLGHRTLTMVQRYAHLATENVTTMGDTLHDRMFGK